MKYSRTYTDKLCAACGDTIVAPKGPKRFCEPCVTSCSIEGCKNPVRSKRLCATHQSKNASVPLMIPRGSFCALEGCDQPHRHCGVCRIHYARFYKTGSFGSSEIAIRHSKGAPCLVDGCDRLSTGRGYCATHYARWRTKGEAGGAGLMRAEQGTGSITQTGYRKIKLPAGFEFEHRVVMSKKLGRPLREGENVHRIDGDKLNNDPSNLELWVVAQPSGQRVADRIAAAVEFLSQHGIGCEVFDQRAALSFGM